MKRTYEEPEIVELGPAAALTKGDIGCKVDGVTGNCEQEPPPSPF